MIRLSDRLQIIADRLKDTKTMADIGTDHGFLPIYLVQKGQCDKVILADISLPSLKKAEINCRQYIESKYELRAGDGLQVLKKGEVDAVVIAGMGGKLMVEILSVDMEHTCSFKKFVLQPRTGQGALRKWLLEKGFSIVGEDLVREGEYIPEIITVMAPGEKNLGGFFYEDYGFTAPEAEKHIMYRIPPWIVDSGKLAGEFVARNLKKEEMILKNMALSKNRNVDNEKKVKSNIEYLDNLLRRCRDER